MYANACKKVYSHAFVSQKKATWYIANKTYSRRDGCPCCSLNRRCSRSCLPCRQQHDRRSLRPTRSSLRQRGSPKRRHGLHTRDWCSRNPHRRRRNRRQLYPLPPVRPHRRCCRCGRFPAPGQGCHPWCRVWSFRLNRHRTVSIQASAGACLVTTESILAMSYCENNKLLVIL